ncbi:hypothetical protein, partial [Nocardioides sp.]|uniref:hypothetical protein n=1 Tax=Nocardioides sp. TaxID=35761 RepID=UPI002734C426
MARLTPTITAAALGAGAGWWRKNDIDNARTTLSKQWGTYIEAGAAASGMIADLMYRGMNRELTDTLSIGGLTLLAERLTRSALSGSFGTGSPMAISGRSYAGAMAAGSVYPSAAGAVLRQPS